jgi:hypothetical protein
MQSEPSETCECMVSVGKWWDILFLTGKLWIHPTQKKY